MSYNNEQMNKIKMNSYVLKQGSPDISCVVMTTCNRENRIAIVHERQKGYNFPTQHGLIGLLLTEV